MEASVIFKIANTVAIVAWVIMAILYNHKLTYKIVFNIVIVLLSILYASIIVWSFSNPSAGGSFSSLKGVMTIFENPVAVLAGWVHYLAFDMLTGLFIVYKASSAKISRLLVLPCLFFAFMFGPVGWLMFYVLLCIKEKTIQPTYTSW